MNRLKSLLPSKMSRDLQPGVFIPRGKVLTANEDEVELFNLSTGQVEQLPRKEWETLTFEERIGKVSDHLYVFGDNRYGQLGTGDTTSRFIPTPVPQAKSPLSISAGYFHSLVLLKEPEGKILSFGNVGRKVGLKGKAISAGKTSSAIVDLESNLWVYGQDESPSKILESIVSVSVGGVHTVAISLSQSEVWTFGNNSVGSLGLGKTINLSLPPTKLGMTAKLVSTGDKHSVIVDLDGNAWVFGYNEFGQLGLGDTKDRFRPVKLPHSKRIISVSAGTSHTVLIDESYDTLVVGSNEQGQLGLGKHITQQLTPVRLPIKLRQVSAGHNHTVGIDLEGKVWVFGNNDYGQLGLGDNLARFAPVYIPGLKASRVSAGGWHTLVIPEV